MTGRHWKQVTRPPWSEAATYTDLDRVRCIGSDVKPSVSVGSGGNCQLRGLGL